MTGDPAPARLTSRAAVLGLVGCALAVMGALPVREYLAQRDTLHHLAAAQAAQRGRIAALQEEDRRLHDPAYVTALARQRLHFVRPGEVDYVLIVPTPTPAPGPAGRRGAPAASATGGAAWYTQVWAGVHGADTVPPARAAR